jgi:outer membrane protein assembly factor BamB
MVRLRRQFWAGAGLAALLASGVLAARGEDWTHWRGASRNGITGEASLWQGAKWIEPRPAWTKVVGLGSTSPLVVDGRLYVLGWHDGKDHLQCLDAATGKNLWTQSYLCPQYGRKATGDEGLYGGPTGTPEYDPQSKLLYTLSVDGDLQCWDTAADGKRVWGLNLYERFDPPQRPRFGRSGLRDYGYTTAPLVHGNWLLVEVGDDEGTLYAFEKRTGNVAWKSECCDEAGHTGGPVPIMVSGVPCVAVLTCKHLVVARLDSGHEGKTVGQYAWWTEFANSIATPTVVGNEILITSDYNRHAIVKLRVTLSGIEEVWKQPYPSKVCSPVVHDGHIYLAWEKVRCLDWETGKLKWEGSRRFGDDGSCLVSGDGRLVIWGRGTLALAETAERSADAYRELARIENMSAADCWPHVVLAGSRIYAKDREGKLMCFAAVQQGR